MAKQEILISINVKGADVASESTKKFGQAVDGVTKAQQDYFKALQPNNLEIQKYKILTAEATAATRAKALAELNAAKATKQGRTQSGLNNAILLETGRLASDASYGFTAIANNLSQVVTLFSSFVKTQGSVAESFKNLGKSLIGSGGFLIAIQLLISFGPQIFKFFGKLLGFTTEMRDAFEGAAKTVSDSAGSFEVYIRTLQDSTKSQKEKNDAIKSLNKEFPKYVKQLSDAGLSLKDVANETKEATKITDQYREAILKQAMSRQAQIKIEESAAKMIEIQIEREAKARDKGYDSLLAAETRFEELSNKKERRILDYKEKQEFQRLKGIVKLNQDELEEENKRIDKLLEFVDIEVKQNEKIGRSKKERVKVFKAADLDFDKETQQSRERLLKSLADDEKSQTTLKFDGIRERARLKQKEYEDDQKRRLDEFLASGATEQEELDARKKYGEELKKSKDSLSKYLIQLNQEEATEITNINIKEAQEVQKINRQKLDAEAAYLDEKNRMNGDYSFFETQRNIDTITSDIAAQQAIVDSHAVGTIEREQAELRLFELKKKLNAEEQALAEQKFAFFNQQYTSITDALSETFSVSAQNETIALEESYGRRIAAAEGDAEVQEKLQKELAEKKDKIARKQFKIDKAARIGRALMNTYESAWLAFGSQLVPAAPATLSSAYLAQRVALITGLANVANIARQKYQSSVSAGGGGGGGLSGGGGGSQIKAPDFNVVGASEQSQLAQAVSTAQQQPVKAFVVGKDITTQQELDRNVTNTASFG